MSVRGPSPGRRWSPRPSAALHLNPVRRAARHPSVGCRLCPRWRLDGCCRPGQVLGQPSSAGTGRGGPPSPTSVIPTLSTSTISSASIENMSSPYYYDEFAPVQKTYNSISNEILSAYGNNSTPPAAAVDSSSCRALVPVAQPQALSAYQGTMQYY